ncbi:hypothetical protein, partial [Paraburkholderia caffeinitolerans]|uniref:hypothetical protein n=1 Tax=Paraburkholderia caffeinitolerans TaxID=1723730 RepID=UPI001C2E8C46
HHLDLVHRVHLSIKNLDGHDPRLRALLIQDDFTGGLHATYEKYIPKNYNPYSPMFGAMP